MTELMDFFLLDMLALKLSNNVLLLLLFVAITVWSDVIL